MIQLAKLDRLKVIASAGSEEIGADVAFNYKTTSTDGILEKEGPVDVSVPPISFCQSVADKMFVSRYWDNVSGETLDAALMNASSGARFIVSISYLPVDCTLTINQFIQRNAA